MAGEGESEGGEGGGRRGGRDGGGGGGKGGKGGREGRRQRCGEVGIGRWVAGLLSSTRQGRKEGRKEGRKQPPYVVRTKLPPRACRLPFFRLVLLACGLVWLGWHQARGGPENYFTVPFSRQNNEPAHQYKVIYRDETRTTHSLDRFSKSRLRHSATRTVPKTVM